MRTSLYTVLCIVVRLGAILLFLYTLAALPLSLASVRGGQFGIGAEGMVVGFNGVVLVLAIALWLYPGILARPAAGRGSGQVFDISIDAAQLQYVAFATFGVALAMNGLIDLAGFGLRAMLISGLHDEAYIRVQREDWAKIATLILKVVLGIGLAVGARGLVGVLHRLRYGGVPPAAASDDASDGRQS